jgi:lysophospholipase L1-like esterase
MQSILSTNAEKAFIMICTNDFARGNALNTVFLNYKEITERLLENGFQVYIQSTILVGPSISMRNQSINRLNSKLEQLAALNKNLTYINLNKTLTKSNMLNPKFTYDDLHLNGPGYSAWKNLIEMYVNK